MRAYYKLSAIISLLTFATVAGAQEERGGRRVESITWNPTEHKLTWIVSEKSSERNGSSKGVVKTAYEIDMDAATMRFEGEDRRFSKSEAVRVHALMNLISNYAAESTVWWEAGEGERLDKDGKPKYERKPGPRFDPRRPGPVVTPISGDTLIAKGTKRE